MGIARGHPATNPTHLREIKHGNKTSEEKVLQVEVGLVTGEHWEWVSRDQRCMSFGKKKIHEFVSLVKIDNIFKRV